MADTASAVVKRQREILRHAREAARRIRVDGTRISDREREQLEAEYLGEFGEKQNASPRTPQQESAEP